MKARRKLDSAFGHWLAGFIAGEGCFRIHKEKQGGYYACHFTLKMRDDEEPILREILKKTRVGRLSAERTGRGNSKPCLIWVVQSKYDCIRFIRMIDYFPIRARKAKEYAIWREAYFYWINMKRGNAWHGPRDWSKMVEYKLAIEKAREYPSERR